MELKMSAFLPPIRRIEALKSTSSVRLWVTSNRQVRNWTQPTTHMIMLDVSIPSLMNRIGYTITAEPIMVLAKLITVCVEVSFPERSLEVRNASTF